MRVAPADILACGQAVTIYQHVLSDEAEATLAAVGLIPGYLRAAPADPARRATVTASLLCRKPSWDNDSMPIRSEIQLDTEALAAFCRRNRIKRLALFGSGLRRDFGPDSDVDLLVEFEPGQVPGLIRLAAMELELADLFGGREIDLRTSGDLSPYFREEVQADAVPLYAAA
jgi:hypothetical protein